ncbi:MAG: NYN domain-containing protein [Sulfurimonas sp.]|nr:NYN domain-containing protein [Sulfurimonas sp.]
MKTPPPSFLSQETWSNKPFIPHSLLVWDVENISVRYLNRIKNLARFTPQKRYALSKKPLSLKQERLLAREGFTLFEHYPLSADEKIVELIHRHHLYTHMILISSDSDFVPSVKRFLTKRHVQWIMQDENKKRICMYMNIAHPRLTLTTFSSANHPKNTKKSSSRQQRPPLKNEKAWLDFFKKYQFLID